MHLRFFGVPRFWLIFLAFALAVPSTVAPTNTFAQAAGPGSENPANLPGAPVKAPDTPPQPVPNVPNSPQVQSILDKMSAANALHPKTVEEERHAYSVLSKFAGVPEQVAHVEDRMIPGTGAMMPIRIYASGSGAALPVWVFFHGGAFVAGSLDTHDAPLRAIANRCACIIVSVGYRLAPENHFPSAAEDAYSATKWVSEHAAEIGADANRVAVGGDGAGGNLAAVVTLMARDRGGPHIAFQLLIYPLVDSGMLTHSWISSNDPIMTKDAMLAGLSSYVPVNANPGNPYVSPLRGDLHNLPQAVIITSMEEPARDEDREYAESLEQAGVKVKLSTYDDTVHGFFLMAGSLDAGKKCIDEVAATLKETLAAK